VAARAVCLGGGGLGWAPRNSVCYGSCPVLGQGLFGSTFRKSS
jgi:hypothetical protein